LKSAVTLGKARTPLPGRSGVPRTWLIESAKNNEE
jgi:hypothetical protein